MSYLDFNLPPACSAWLWCGQSQVKAKPRGLSCLLPADPFFQHSLTPYHSMFATLESQKLNKGGKNMNTCLAFVNLQTLFYDSNRLSYKARGSGTWICGADSTSVASGLHLLSPGGGIF